MSDIDPDRISALLVRAGMDILMPAFRQQTNATRTKDDGSVITQTDLACQEFIRSELARRYPDIAFLGEEMTLEEQQACLDSNHKRYWCLDPLDGTTNFVASLPVFGTSLALIEDGNPVLACIHDPVRQETFTAIRGDNACLNGEPIHASKLQALPQAVGFIDFKRLSPDLAARLAIKLPCRSQRNIGSCALEWAWLATGRAHFIVHGREKLWDYAAGALIAEAAGCAVSNFDGHHLFDEAKLSSPIVAAANIDLHRQALQMIRSN